LIVLLSRSALNIYDSKFNHPKLDDLKLNHSSLDFLEKFVWL
jgi:hypothetical protein